MRFFVLVFSYDSLKGGWMELGERIAVLREEQALTQAELAEEARISPSTLSQIESGRVPRPHVGTVRKIARALGVEPAELRRTKEMALPKVEASATGLSLEEFLLRECGHAYLARGRDAIVKLIRDADPLMVDGIMDQLNQELTALGKERKKYTPWGKGWEWQESSTDIMWKYLQVSAVAQTRSPERKEAVERMFHEQEGETPPSTGAVNS